MLAFINLRIPGPLSTTELIALWQRRRIKLSAEVGSFDPRKWGRELNVARTAVAQMWGDDHDPPQIRLDLTGENARDFFRSGLVESLRDARTYIPAMTLPRSTPEPFEAILVETPPEQIYNDPNKWLGAARELAVPLVISAYAGYGNELLLTALSRGPAMPLFEGEVDLAEQGFVMPGVRLPFNAAAPLYLASFLRSASPNCNYWVDYVLPAWGSEEQELLDDLFRVAERHFDETGVS